MRCASWTSMSSAFVFTSRTILSLKSSTTPRLGKLPSPSSPKTLVSTCALAFPSDSTTVNSDGNVLAKSLLSFLTSTCARYLHLRGTCCVLRVPALCQPLTHHVSRITFYVSRFTLSVDLGRQFSGEHVERGLAVEAEDDPPQSRLPSQVRDGCPQHNRRRCLHRVAEDAGADGG